MDDSSSPSERMSQPGQTGDADLPMSLTANLAQLGLMAGSAIPPEARAVAQLSLLDWLAVLHAGKDEAVSRILQQQVLDEAAPGQASLAASSRQIPPRLAALANGTTSHALDYDDTHFGFVGHPSVAVFPAAMAIAEAQQASLPAMLDAALLGMEAACRIGMMLGSRHYNAGFHQTATAGCFGATVAAGRLLGLDLSGLTMALGLVATRASGLKSQFGTMGKPFNAGMAASNGVEAALLASRGFVAAADGVGCSQGFLDTHQAEQPVAAGLPVPPQGKMFFHAVTHKFHACCHGTHAMLEALQELISSHQLAAHDIAGITLVTNPRWLKVCDIAAPQSGLEIKFSYRHLAAMAAHGICTAAIENYDHDMAMRADLAAFRQRVRVVTDETLADTAARLQLQTHAGVLLEAEHDLAVLPRLAERQARVLAKASTLLGEDRAALLWQSVGSQQQDSGIASLDPLAALIRARD